MRRFGIIGLLILAMGCFCSCEVDFSPNAEWKEIPVVYCVLDQDDDTTWVRVQKCFLGNENLYDYAAISDSSNYPQGSISVRMEKWKAYKATPTSNFLIAYGDAPEAVYDFEYVEHSKDSGLFAYPMQPVYAYRTYKLLDTSSVYRLVILKTATGDTLATAETSLLGGTGKVTKVNDFSLNTRMALFKFTGSQNICTFAWTPWTRGRLYQPTIRFYYKESGELRHVDIKCSSVKDKGNALSLTTSINKGTYFGYIEDALKDDTCHKTFVHHVDIMIDACNEDLNAYINSLNALHSGSTNSQVYTNIDNGVGVFASRKMMTATVPSDSAVGDGSYVDILKDMNLGF